MIFIKLGCGFEIDPKDNFYDTLSEFDDGKLSNSTTSSLSSDELMEPATSNYALLKYGVFASTGISFFLLKGLNFDGYNFSSFLYVGFLVREDLTLLLDLPDFLDFSDSDMADESSTCSVISKTLVPFTENFAGLT